MSELWTNTSRFCLHACRWHRRHISGNSNLGGEEMTKKSDKDLKNNKGKGAIDPELIEKWREASEAVGIGMGD